MDKSTLLKTCTKCREVKPLAEFHRNKRGPQGRSSSCKACVSSRMKHWYTENTQQAIANAAKWQEANYVKHLANVSAYAKANPHRILAKNARRRSHTNPAGYSLIPKSLLRAKFDYHAGKCWMCGNTAECWDHVKPIRHGGPHLLANLRPACKSCNGAKSARWFGVAELYRFRRLAEVIAA